MWDQNIRGLYTFRVTGSVVPIGPDGDVSGEGQYGKREGSSRSIVNTLQWTKVTVGTGVSRVLEVLLSLKTSHEHTPDLGNLITSCAFTGDPTRVPSSVGEGSFFGRRSQLGRRRRRIPRRGVRNV